MAFDLDLFVIGGGSGGVRAARIAANHGARVAIAEDDRWGGTCVIRGCVPKKLLVYGSEVTRHLADARGYGWTIESTFDWATLRTAVQTEVARLSGLYAANLRDAGATLHQAYATVVDPHTVEVGGRRVTTANILVATGSHANTFDFAAKDDRWITSDGAFLLPELPKRLVVVGSGYVGVEFAHIFAGLGVEVIMVLRRELPLHGFDQELREACRDGLLASGVRLECATEVLGSERAGAGLRLALSNRTELETDLALAAIGRTPSGRNLGLEAAGVTLGPDSAIVVDEWCRTSVPNIYAVGDVTGNLGLTPVAIREGHAVADTLFGGEPTAIRHALVPTAVFAQPPIACVGLGEAEAAAAGADVQVVKTRFKPLRHTLSGRDERVVMKVVLDRPSRRVLGVHMAGPDAPEIVQAAAIAVTMGATMDDLRRTFALHPTTAEELVLLKE
jgi:glutathione reductase (NADPH)